MLIHFRSAVRALLPLALTSVLAARLCQAQEAPPATAPAVDPAAEQAAKDQIAAVNKAVTDSDADLNTAVRYSDNLKALTDTTSSAGPFADRLREIDRLVKDVSNHKFLDALQKRRDDISTAAGGLNDKCDKTKISPGTSQNCDNASANASDRQKQLQDATSSLADQLKAVPPFIASQLTNTITLLDDGTADWSTTIAAADFAASVPKYTQACPTYVAYKKVAESPSLCDALNKLSVNCKATGSDPDAQKTTLGEKLKTHAGEVDAILKNIQTQADADAKKVADAVTAVTAKPAESAQSASDAAAAGGKTARGIQAVSDVWPSLEKGIQECDGSATTDLSAIRLHLRDVEAAGSELRNKLSLLNDVLAGDASQFTEEPVLLFYYTEVEKLMRSLNERTDWAGGNNAAATAAQSQRELLLDAESRVTQARGEVGDLQYELQKLQEQQRQADAALGTLGLLSQKASEVKKRTDSVLRKANEDYGNAKTASDADPTNTAKQADLQKATLRKDTADKKDQDAAAKETDAQAKLKDAQAQQKAASADKDSLQARIDLAKGKLQDAQRNLEDAQRSAARAAIEESDAFAAARDQTPYLGAPALATSNDPVRRVVMRGYPDRNLILLRGKRDDVAAVKRIISDFDTPAPQARLTLWSTEISAELRKPLLWSKRPPDRLNEAMAIVDYHLGLARSNIATATIDLRQNVNEAVSNAETGIGKPGEYNYRCLELDMPTGLSVAEQARWKRFLFYSPGVLIQAGVNMASAESFRHAALPDPAATTTVGEALMILSLSCGSNRTEIFKSFELHSEALNSDAKEYFSALSQATLKKKPRKTEKTEEEASFYQSCFRGLAQVLQVEATCLRKAGEKKKKKKKNKEKKGETPKYSSAPESSSTEKLQEARKELASEREAHKNDERGTLKTLTTCRDQLKECTDKLAEAASEQPCGEVKVNANEGLEKSEFVRPSASAGITETQLEIVRALRAAASKKVFRDMENLRAVIIKEEESYQKLKANGPVGLSPSETNACRVKVAEIKSLYNRYNKFINTQFRTLYPNDFENFQLVPDRADFKLRVALQSKETWQKLTEAGPRVAAADEMLKRMMTRLEDDLDQQYIQPMLKNLRAELINQGLTVGVIQRTSVLATNRLKARVDPKGMYDLSVGEQQDLLASAGQLASIYLTAQTGGALAAFGSLNSLSQKQEQRIYGITTGSKFEVTPIFDPSGQALRFKFDYVSNSLIRNPQGAVDATMPSLRHTINTEVQLSNLEIREVSRYESNAKLGIPVRYWGGIPILADIPGFKPIPLIGWFVRRAGSNAEAQQSVIFGQTTIYPTIGSIVDLLQTGN